MTSRVYDTYNTSLTMTGSRRDPFVDGIMVMNLPAIWKALTVDHYDGSSDLDEHIDTYVMQVSLYMTNDEVLSRVFPTLLKVMALSLTLAQP